MAIIRHGQMLNKDSVRRLNQVVEWGLPKNPDEIVSSFLKNGILNKEGKLTTLGDAQLKAYYASKDLHTSASGNGELDAGIPHRDPNKRGFVPC